MNISWNKPVITGEYSHFLIEIYELPGTGEGLGWQVRNTNTKEIIHRENSEPLYTLDEARRSVTIWLFTSIRNKEI